MGDRSGFWGRVRKKASEIVNSDYFVVPVQLIDALGAVGGGSSAATTLAMMNGPNVYKSPVQFAAAQFAATQLDLSGHPVLSGDIQFRGVLAKTSAGVYSAYFPENPNTPFSWDASNSRLTVTGATFAATDQFMVVLEASDRYGDTAGDYLKIAEVLPYLLRGDDAGIPLITAAETLTAAWADIGPEIPMHGYNRLKLWTTLDINLSTDTRIRVLEKHTSGGSEEYDPVIETVSASDTKVESDYWEFNVDADALNTLVFKGDGLTPYVQVQGMVGTLGGTAADIDALYYTRGVFGG
jgi:hypothetical protein